MAKGLFLVVEGPDGAGKTTVTEKVVERLRKEGYDLIHTREPGGIAIAEQIRSVILDPANTAMDGKTEALLYAAARRQHLVEKIAPAVASGRIVICERFLESSLAYQGYGRQLGFDDILAINRFAIGEFMPDKTFYLDVDEETGLKRVESRGNKDRMDSESLAFHKRVIAGYQQVLKTFGPSICRIDASLTFDEVVTATYRAIKDYIDDQR